MSVKLKVKVTKDITRKAMWCGVEGIHPWTKSVSESCGVALAVIDIFPHARVYDDRIIPARDFSVDLYDQLRSDDCIHLPKTARDFIRAFDNLVGNPEARLDLPELEFEVEIPDEVIEQIDIEGIRPLLVNHPTLELV